MYKTFIFQMLRISVILQFEQWVIFLFFHIIFNTQNPLGQQLCPVIQMCD